ncbi:hypothetical protein [Streptomyces sp. S3(2020)]|nr:hypothetical protein [Streptomyces sp. S3(2020)]
MTLVSMYVRVEQAEVTAYAANTDAIRFYERGGFAPQSVTLRQAL